MLMRLQGPRGAPLVEQRRREKTLGLQARDMVDEGAQLR